ncbi:MAG: hypothetical protein R8K20_06295 [Gallionellaceae bacterium]
MAFRYTEAFMLSKLTCRVCEAKGHIQLFPRDPMLVIGNHLIETEPFSTICRREKFGIRRALFKRVTSDRGAIGYDAVCCFRKGKYTAVSAVRR